MADITYMWLDASSTRLWEVAFVEGMTDEEQTTVRDFVDRDVKPVVRDYDHSNTYPEKLIEQMKDLGIFGLAIPEPRNE